MASKALFGVSQSSLLLQQPKLGLSHGRTTVCLITLRSPSIASFSSGLRASNRTKLRAAIISDAKSSDSFTVESGNKKSDVELDSGGGAGGGLGGNEGGGGGGGGDDNNRGDGDGESQEEGGGKKKMAMSMSQKLTLGYAALVGVGGLMGYLKSGSQKSLLSGGLSAALLFFVFTQLPTNPVLASSLGLGISAVLLIVMGSRFKNSRKIFPAGVVSLISLIMTGGYFHGIQRGAH